jgi:alpha-mannosidase
MSSKSKRKCFLVCNAHLDPAWLWKWEEGLTEAISTFRVAADFCDEFSDFVFNHNEALLYEWVERNDPELFERIKDLVKKGRWHIAGGAYLQPDLIGTSGESLIRQFLYGQKYFTEKFNKRPTTAYNFDSFGHSAGMIQILTGCGYDSYIFCRPEKSQYELPLGTFHWKHHSGAEIAARRSDDFYSTNLEIRKQIKKCITQECHKSENNFMFLWGIGNHGGGPSHKEYADLKKLSNDWPDIDFIESTPDDFFKQIFATNKDRKFPVVQGSLKTVFEGCYTSMMRVKQAHRLCENLIDEVERFASIAWWINKINYPQKDLEVAWKDILFAEFHDILPGSGTPSVESDSLKMLGHCEDILRRKRAEIMISLLRNEPLAERNETPIFVFNPHPWPVTQEVCVECGLDLLHPVDSVIPEVFKNGEKIDIQTEKPENNIYIDWRPKISFIAHVPPMSYSRYDTFYTVKNKKEIIRWKTPKLSKDGIINAGSIKLKINFRTGLIDKLEVDNECIWQERSAAPLILRDKAHSWETHAKWRRPIAGFRLATRKEAAVIMGSDVVNKNLKVGKSPINIIEDGSIRMVVEAILVHKSSYIAQRYVIYKKRPVLEIDQDIFMTEHDRMLKLSFSYNPCFKQIESEKCYSIDDETYAAENGTEQEFQHLLRLHDACGGFALLSHGVQGYSNYDGKLRISILRTPPYAAAPWGIKNASNCDRFNKRFVPRHEQGFRTSRITFLFGELAAARASSVRTAWEYKIPLSTFIYFPTKRLAAKKLVKSFASIDIDNVILGALKRTEDEQGLIFRFWETAGRDTDFTLTLENIQYKLTIKAHSLISFRLMPDGTMVKNDLLERKL